MPTIRHQQGFFGWRAALAAAAVSLMLGACSMDTVAEYKPKLPDFTNFEFSPYSKASSMAPSMTRRAATPADYINPDGSCAGASPESAAAEATQQQIQAGVALEMTECAVVRVLGTPQQIDIGANERGDRAVKMRYSQGERRGLYHFTAGQLTLIERIDEPPPPPKPQKPAPKPRRAAT